MKKKTYLLMALAMVSMGMNAQNSEKSSLGNNVPEFVKTMKIGGTIRSKYEYQTEEGEGRFEVRTARINVAGNVTKEVSYKAEIDLCDEGKIKMLDAYTRIKPWKTLQLTIGQERVPFTIDAHRSPHQQYFANRSFIAKQVGNVRDVGAEIGYTWNVGFPIVVNAGIFNGSGLTNQKDYWTKGVNYSAKVQFLFPNVNLVLSTQKIKPSDVTVTMYDGGSPSTRVVSLLRLSIFTSITVRMLSTMFMHSMVSYAMIFRWLILRALSGRFRLWQDMIS